MHWKHKTFEIEVARKVEDGWDFLCRERCPVSTPHHGEEMRALFPSSLVRELPLTTEELALGPCTGRAKWTNGSYLANLNCQKLSAGTCCSRVQGYNWERNDPGADYSSKISVSCGPMGHAWEDERQGRKISREGCQESSKLMAGGWERSHKWLTWNCNS